MKNYDKSCNILFLGSEFKRKNDVFCLILTDEEKCVPKEYKLILVSTISETEDMEKELLEIEKIICPIEKFIKIEEICEMKEIDGVFGVVTEDGNVGLEQIMSKSIENYKKIHEQIKKDLKM